MFQAEFARRGFAPQVLSRLAADSGTPTSALVPWNSCAAFMAAVLGISTISYLPFAVFNYVAPLLSLVYRVTGFEIARTTPASETAV
jgi:NhaC family Na+:H+ antiporter